MPFVHIHDIVLQHKKYLIRPGRHYIFSFCFYALKILFVCVCVSVLVHVCMLCGKHGGQRITFRSLFFVILRDQTHIKLETMFDP